MSRDLAPSRAPESNPEQGVALVLTLIFSILLYILVAELVVAGRMVRSTGENDALLARMRTQMLYQLADVEEDLLSDLAGQAEEAGGGGSGLGSALGGAAGAAGAGGAAGAAGGAAGGAPPAEEEDPSTKCDSSRDSWFHPVAHADNDLTTYVWVEDENRKFNILALWSPDEKFAEFSRDRLIRLLDALREDSEFDIPTSDADRLVQEIVEWGKRPDLEALPVPRLKSYDEKRREFTVPLHLDELLMLPSMTEDLFYDKAQDGIVYLGLESVLTVWTSLKTDPGDPEKVARQRAQAQANGESAPEAPAGSGEGGQAPGAAAPGAAAGAPGGQEASPPQPEGLGIRININTATRPVLRALFPAEKIPDRVIDAILRYRNKENEEEVKKAAEEAVGTELSDFGDLRLGADKKLQFFETVADLEKVEEFANLTDQEIKVAFQNALTTKSDVFSIHLVTLFKRNDENRVYVLRRARSIVLRLDDGADGKIIPLVPFEERIGLRLQPVDLQDENVDLGLLYGEMDQFAQEERAWNPFLIDFYLPKYRRDEFYRPR